MPFWRVCLASLVASGDLYPLPSDRLQPAPKHSVLVGVWGTRSGYFGDSELPSHGTGPAYVWHIEDDSRQIGHLTNTGPSSWSVCDCTVHVYNWSICPGTLAIVRERHLYHL